MMTVTLLGKRRVQVATFREASQAVRLDIEASDVGASEWYGRGAGRIYEGKRQIAYVSYNGRVWKGAEDGTVHEEIQL